VKPATRTPAALLHTADELDRKGDDIWLESERLLEMATRLKRQARELREAAGVVKELAAAAEWLGPDIRIVETDAA
jgi:hypothetical protein